MTPILTMILSVLVAACFMVATWCMKLFSDSTALLAIPVIILFLGLGAWLEIEVLRTTRMGHVAVLVLAIELVLTFAIACTALGESYSWREMTGVAVIVAGMVLLSAGSAHKPSSSANLATAKPVMPEVISGSMKHQTFKENVTRQTNQSVQRFEKKMNRLTSSPLRQMPEPQAFSTSTPGRTLPSIHSRNAPPAVEI